MATLRDQILAADDLPTEVVETPEWGPSGVPSVVVRGLSGHDRDQYEQSLVMTGADGRTRAKPNLENMRAGFVALVIVDPETKERAFKPTDVKELGKKSAEVLDRIWNVGRRISGMATVEEANPSEAGQPEPSYSDSASPSESPTPTTSQSDSPEPS